MADKLLPGDGPAPGESREAFLRREYLSQTAQIHWHELQTYFAGGNVVQVAAELDLVEVAVQLGLDNSAQFEAWIGAGQIAPVSDDLARAWFEVNQRLWAVVAAPWVLVQSKA
ncbi:MAG: DUF2288 domain-containing protein [Pseudomonadota bacterium]